MTSKTTKEPPERAIIAAITVFMGMSDRKRYSTVCAILSDIDVERLLPETPRDEHECARRIIAEAKGLAERSQE